MTDAQELAVRAIDSYELMFPDDPAVIRLRQARRDMEAAIQDLGRWFGGD